MPTLKERVTDHGGVRFFTLGDPQMRSTKIMRRGLVKAKTGSDRTTMPAKAGSRNKSKAKEDEVTEPIPSAFSEEEEEASDEENEDDDDDEEVDSDEEEEGVLLSELDSDAEGSDIDIVPYQKLHKDNHAALTQALSTFSLPLASLPFHIHQSITSSSLDEIDVNDDLNRELAFYKQALDAVQQGRKQLLEEGIPFSRPADYFAEMVKDDEHMDKVPFPTKSRLQNYMLNSCLGQRTTCRGRSFQESF